MKLLTPALAAEIADNAYYAQHSSEAALSAAVSPRVRQAFSISGERLTGTAGTVFERLFRHQAGFGFIGQGRESGGYQGHYLLAIRGTAAKREVLTDLHFGLNSSSNHKKVHAGFNRVFSSQQDQLAAFFDKAPPGPVHCVGHSLGGALANLAANWLKTRYAVPVALYTFGAPRVGLSDFASASESRIESIHRCTHHADPVPMVPVWPFIHAGADYCLDRSKGFKPSAHKMGYYSINAAAYKDYRQMAGQRVSVAAPTRLDYARRHEVSFTYYWAERITQALITLLKDAGQYTTIAASVGMCSTLTFYDLLARSLETIANLSTRYAEQQRGLLGAMLVFAGKPTVKVTELTYTFIRSVLDLMIKALMRVVRTALDAI